MGDRNSFYPTPPNDTDQSGGIVVIAQGLTQDPIHIEFPEMRTGDSFMANVVDQEGTVIHELNVESQIVDFTGLQLPTGQNKLVVWSGDDRQEALI